MTHTDTPGRKRKRKTVEQRFDDWWARTFQRHGLSLVPTDEDLKAVVRSGYFNGWDACTRTKRRADTAGSGK